MTTRRPRQVRAVGWGLFGVLVITALAVAQASMSATFAFVLDSALLYIGPMILALAAAGFLAFRYLGSGLEHRFWGLLALALAMLLTSELYFTWYVAAVDPVGPSLPGWFELLQLASGVLFLSLIVTMTEFGSRPLVTRIRFYLDVFAAMVVALPLIYWFVALPLFEGVAQSHRVAAVAALYPLFGFCMIVGVASIVFGWRSYRWRAWEVLIASSFTIYGLGLMSFPWWYRDVLASGTAMSASAFSIVLGAGYYLLFMSAIYRVTGGTRAALVEAWPVPRVESSWLSGVYPATLVAATPMLIWAAIATSSDPHGPLVAGSAFMLAAVLVVRSWLVALERGHHSRRAITDPVTGAYNHRHLHERLVGMVSNAAATNRPLSVIVFDVEDFRSINHMHGHREGDAVLAMVADILRRTAPISAEVFRLGSDEFAITLPGVDAVSSLGYARLAWIAVQREVVLPTGPGVGVVAGVATYPMHGSDGEMVLANALAAQFAARGVEDEPIVVYDAARVGGIDPAVRARRARQRSHQATVRALAAAVDARDPDTKNHSQNVADLASALAQVLGLTEEQVQLVALASLLHDVGKIGIRDDVLRKGAALTGPERDHVRQHPDLGERILAPTALDDVLPIVRHHHERWDGTGYPDGLAGVTIPLEARILSVCDSFEAMTAGRAYHEAFDTARAVAEIESGAGTQFDPEVAAAFTRMVSRLSASTAAAPSSPVRLGLEPTSS